MSFPPIEDYSDKALAVFGKISPALEEGLIKLGGKFNPVLKGLNDTRRPGWIFPKSKRDQVSVELKKHLGTSTTSSSSSTSSTSNSTSTSASNSTPTSTPTSIDTIGTTIKYVSLQAFQTLEKLVHNLSSRVEVIETEQRKRPASKLSKIPQDRYDVEEENEETSDEPEDNNKVTKSFMKKK
jgi:hypothetical protein